jgi:L-iditol 2-dehydrogenase
MLGKMKQAVHTEPFRLEIHEVDIPSVAPDGVLVKVEYIGLCGSDLHGYERMGTKISTKTFPFIWGHETGGTVVEVGEAVTTLKPGDRVAMEPGITCGVCEFCREGKYNLCPEVKFFAANVPGTFQEYVTHPASLCFKLPENVSTMEGALIEPLAVGFHAAMQSGARVGKRAMVFGVGCIGLMSMLAMKAMGVTEIIAVDILQNRVDKAQDMGATHAVNAAREDVIAASLAAFGDRPWCDIVIDTSGEEIAYDQATTLLKKGGTLVIVGYNSADRIILPSRRLIDKEIEIQTVYRYRHVYPMAIEAVASGRLDVKSVVTNFFDLDNIQEAMDKSLENKAEIVKAVVRV